MGARNAQMLCEKVGLSLWTVEDKPSAHELAMHLPWSTSLA